MIQGSPTGISFPDISKLNGFAVTKSLQNVLPLAGLEL